jgi:zinc and cadmium transporter
MLSYIIIATLAVGFIGVLGAFLGLRVLTKTPERTILTVSFAAGAMICASVLEILPEAFQAGNVSAATVLFFTLIGFIVFYVLERSLILYHCHQDNCQVHASSWLIIIGDTLHNFLDGLAVAASFLAGSSVGLVTTLAIIIHEIPQEIGDFGVLMHAGYSRKKALLFNFLSAGAGVLGGVGGFFLLEKYANSLPYLLALTAGAFFYIGAADLLPQTHKLAERKLMLKRSALFLAGIILLWALGLVIGE